MEGEWAWLHVCGHMHKDKPALAQSSAAEGNQKWLDVCLHIQTANNTSRQEDSN